MRRWFFALLIVVIISASVLLVMHLYRPAVPTTPARSGLVLIPSSAYKYQLCTEAFAFAFATPDNPYKTDFTFKDPFRNANDTIVPHLQAYDAQTRTVNFNVDVIIARVATFHESISNVHELDGIGIILPDKQERLNYTAVPQLVISHFGTGKIAVLDYTCPNQWIWKLAR
jgi:hypothetical protein